MKNYISFLLLSMLFLAAPVNLQAQFLKKLQKKIDKKLDKVFETDEDKEDTTSSDTSYENNDSSDYTANYEDFVTGNTTIFFDDLSGNEVIHQHPSKWRTSYSNAKDVTEIVMYKGEKVIRLGARHGISPIMTKNKEDYLPDNFTIEFDASFSANAPEQRYWIKFYDLKDQEDIVKYKTLVIELNLTTFGVTDDLTEGTLKGHGCYEKSPTFVWRHIAMAYKNNTLEFYYDGHHVFHLGDIEGDPIGVTISRSELSSNDRYLKNIIIATN